MWRTSDEKVQVRQEDLSEQTILLGMRHRRSEKRREDLKTPLQRVHDPTGRVDWLIGAIVEKFVEERRNTVLLQAYNQLRVPMEQLLKSRLGPRNKQLRQVRKYITEGQKMLAEARRGSSHA